MKFRRMIVIMIVIPLWVRPRASDQRELLNLENRNAIETLNVENIFNLDYRRLIQIVSRNSTLTRSRYSTHGYEF